MLIVGTTTYCFYPLFKVDHSPIKLHKKIFYHPDKMGEFFSTGSTSPISWELDLTNACNHDCIGCSAKGAGGRTNNDKLSLDQAQNYIDQIASLNAKAVNLTGGGEPMMNKITPSIIEYIKAKSLDVGLVSNGSLFRKSNVDLISKNCTWVRVSLDSGSPQVFQDIRRRPGKEYYEILDNIKLLVDSRNNQKSSCTIGVGFLTSKKTIPDMYDFTIACKKAGVDYVEFRPFHGDYTIPKNINECLTLQDSDFKIHYSKFKYDSSYKKKYCKCLAQSFSGVINVHKVYVCCHFRGVEKYELGDLRQNSLQEIWTSDRRKEIVDNIDFKDCIALCKLDLVNRSLDEFTEKPNHVNFI